MKFVTWLRRINCYSRSKDPINQVHLYRRLNTTRSQEIEKELVSGARTVMELTTYLEASAQSKTGFKQNSK
jgi:hypothetical protein